jgi:methyl-accepting chemotaxis protein
MDFNNTWFIISAGIGAVLFIMLIVLYFISRKSQRVMESMISIITDPNRAKIQDASRVLQTIMADEIGKISTCFKNMHETLRAQIVAADELRQKLGAQNEELVNIANDAVTRIAQMSGRIDNTVSGLRDVVNSDSWNDVANATDRFASTVENTLTHITNTTTESTNKITQIDTSIEKWTETSEKLSDTLQKSIDNNTEHFEKMVGESENIQEKITNLSKSATDGFAEMKGTASNYEDVLKDNNKTISTYLTKLDSFDKQSKKQLNSQTTTLTNTVNLLSAQVLITESAVENQVRKLTDAVEAVITSATETESAVRGISSELSGLTNHFEDEIKEFATDVVSELKTVSGVADATLQDTKTSANAFSESVKAMATGVRETLIEMNTAHTQLAGQSEGLIKMSTDTTAQLKPLSELIEKYYVALPDLVKTSGDAGTSLAKIVSELDDKIASIRATVEESSASVSESAAKLDNLAGQSRQQMIDLMADYAKAVETMQTLNKQMMVARAAAPMDAIGTTPSTAPRASSRDFLAQSTREFDKLYEQTLDLTRAMGSNIPDVVWKKYHDGDKTIFAKWMVKMVRAMDKKQVRELIKSDSVFNSQATQFVRAFDKIMAAAKQTDTPDKLAVALLKTDLGIIYSALAPQIQ